MLIIITLSTSKQGRIFWLCHTSQSSFSRLEEINTIIQYYTILRITGRQWQYSTNRANTIRCPSNIQSNALETWCSGLVLSHTFHTSDSGVVTDAWLVVKVGILHTRVIVTISIHQIIGPIIAHVWTQIIRQCTKLLPP
jgi:hypothetical protein